MGVCLLTPAGAGFSGRAASARGRTLDALRSGSPRSDAHCPYAAQPDCALLLVDCFERAPDRIRVVPSNSGNTANCATPRYARNAWLRPASVASLCPGHPASWSVGASIAQRKVRQASNSPAERPSETVEINLGPTNQRLITRKVRPKLGRIARHALKMRYKHDRAKPQSPFLG